MESNILRLIAEHEKSINGENGILKQLEKIRIQMTDFVSRKAVLTTAISLIAVAVVIGGYMFGIDKRLVRIEEQFKSLNDKQGQQIQLIGQMLKTMEGSKGNTTKGDKQGGN